jgi:hypothetical protein
MVKQWVTVKRADGSFFRREVDVLYPKNVYEILQKVKKRKEEQAQAMNNAVAEIQEAWKKKEEII